MGRLPVTHMGKGGNNRGAQVIDFILSQSDIPVPKNKDDLATKGLVHQMIMETDHNTGMDAIHCPDMTQFPMAGDQATI